MISYALTHKSGRTFRERNHKIMHPNKRAWIWSAVIAGLAIVVAVVVFLATWRPFVPEARVSGYRPMPEGTQLMGSYNGRHGEARALYRVPDKGYLETVQLSSRYSYSDFYHEVAEANQMISGNLQRFPLGGFFCRVRRSSGQPKYVRRGW